MSQAQGQVGHATPVAGIGGAAGAWRLTWRRLRRDPAAIVAVIVIAVIALLAIGAPLLAWVTGHPADPPNLEGGTNALGQPLPPGTSGYLLGTDNLGRDVLVRVAYGARASLFVGLVATAVATLAGVSLGLLAGFLGGWIDTLLARSMDVVLSYPYLLLALALVSVYGASLLVTILVIALFGWAAIGRVVRGQTISQRQGEYVKAAQALGASDLRIMFIDILPNVLAPVIVLATILIPFAIVLEASLSFFGVGIAPPTASWGNMLSDVQSSGGYQAWWFWLFPSAALALTTIAFNMLGDAVRDALDPNVDRLHSARLETRP